MKLESSLLSAYVEVYKKNKIFNYFLNIYGLDGFFNEKDIFQFMDELIIKSLENYIFEFLSDCKLYLEKIKKDLPKYDNKFYKTYDNDEFNEYFDLDKYSGDCFSRNHFFDCVNRLMTINFETGYNTVLDRDLKYFLYFHNKEILKMQSIVNVEIKIFKKYKLNEYVKYISETDIEYKLKHEKDFELLNKNEIINSQRKHFNNKYIDYYKPYEDILKGKSKITSNEYNFAYYITSETDKEEIKPFPAFLILCYRNRNNKDFKLIFPDIDILNKVNLRKIHRNFYQAKRSYDKGINI